jgi:hypothetical protein
MIEPFKHGRREIGEGRFLGLNRGFQQDCGVVRREASMEHRDGRSAGQSHATHATEKSHTAVIARVGLLAYGPIS